MITDVLTTPVNTPVLALVTTVHAAILLLRSHRNPTDLRHAALLLPSIVLTASPWWFPTPAGILSGIALHLIWFAACERWLPQEKPTSSAAPPVRPRSPAPPQATKHPLGERSSSPSGFVQVPVIGVCPETDDITTFRMSRPEGSFFTAGQFTSVKVNIDGKPVVRCYTVSSAPEAAGYFEISVKRQGLKSGTLHASIRPGSMVSVMPPTGSFAYPSNDDRPIALLAGGVGITPMMSMLRHAVAVDPSRPVTLLYSVHTHGDVAFRNELRLLAARHPQAKIIVTTTRGPHSTDCLSGRIDTRMIANQVNDVANTIYMICGPAPMIDGMKASLAELGVPAGQVRSEAFEAAIPTAAHSAPTAPPATPPPRGSRRPASRLTTRSSPRLESWSRSIILRPNRRTGLVSVGPTGIGPSDCGHRSQRKTGGVLNLLNLEIVDQNASASPETQILVIENKMEMNSQ